MRITIRLYGNLKKYLRKKETAQMDIEAGTTIRAVLARLGIPDAEVWMSAANDQVVGDTTVLQDGDVLEVFEPVGGGGARRASFSSLLVALHKVRRNPTDRSSTAPPSQSKPTRM